MHRMVRPVDALADVQPSGFILAYCGDECHSACTCLHRLSLVAARGVENTAALRLRSECTPGEVANSALRPSTVFSKKIGSGALAPLPERNFANVRRKSITRSAN